MFSIKLRNLRALLQDVAFKKLNYIHVLLKNNHFYAGSARSISAQYEMRVKCMDVKMSLTEICTFIFSFGKCVGDVVLFFCGMCSA